MIRQIVTFEIDSILFGVDILIVKEIFRNMILNPVPNAPELLSGLTNIRGQIVTVFNLRACLNLSYDSVEPSNELLVFKTQDAIRPFIDNGTLNSVNLGNDMVGFLIDRTHDIITISDNDVLPPPPTLTQIPSDMVNGIVHHEQSLVVLLNVETVLHWAMASHSFSEDKRMGQ